LARQMSYAAHKQADKEETSQKKDPSSKDVIKKSPMPQKMDSKDTEPIAALPKDAAAGGGSREMTIGSMLESTPMQWLIVLLILYDIIGTILLLLLDAGVKPFGLGQRGVDRLNILIELTTDGCLCVFIAEAAMLAVVFNFRALLHAGYVIDLLVVSTCTFFRFAASRRVGVRLLGVVRFWRIARVFWSGLAASEAAHATTQEKLDVLQAEAAALRLQRDEALKEAQNDQDARRDVQKMMRRYKERVDHLSEALKIASETVARAQAGFKPDGIDSNIPQILVSSTGAFQVKPHRSAPVLRRRPERRNPELWTVGDESES